ncbi:putative DNA metabolism protein [Jejuia pallidilutea]|uniref:Putative DNA metabolism protein n=1 Tax=Jejuia pallidilutea TaxID=504487 RepID=A0A362X1F7_9FLAO|nr:TIGR03915 family putative DNA repair protein [Jejuia pallidilutea]PQV47425.1 putative DNA metabolism protein [Jejuia pallidilutea]
MQATTLVYDGSFNGFLTTVFEIYEKRIALPIIKKETDFQKDFFSETDTIISSSDKAKRVFKGIKKLLKTKGCNTIYYAFLSEIIGVENTLYNVIKYAFTTQQNIISDYSNVEVLALSKIARKVSREKHRMEAFVRFQETKDGIYFANIEPDFNVLPLINYHFTKRYADQKWIIYDLKRKYGLFYNLKKTEIITLNFNVTTKKKDWFTLNENEYKTLWKEYFESTNIEERINTKLHIQHVPKRYWKYLSEKQP